MKKILFFLAATAVLFSCNEEIESRASFRYYVVRQGVEQEYPQVIYAQEQVVFESTGAGDYFVVYTGAPESVYSERTLSAEIASADSNIVGSKSIGYTLTKRAGVYSYAYTYTNNGPCNIAFIATAISKDGLKSETDVNTDYSLQVIDSVGMLTDMLFVKPFSLMKSKIVVTGSTYNVMVPFGTKLTGFSKCTVNFKAGKATVSRSGVVLEPFKNIFEDVIDLTSPVIYGVTAPNGKVYSYTVQITPSPYVQSSSNLLNSIDLAGTSYASIDNKVEILYPANSENVAVVFNASSKSVVKLDGVSLKENYTVADLIASGSSLVVTSETGVESAPYVFTLKEDVLSFMPILFDGATGFPLAKDDVAKTIEFALSSSFNKSKLQPIFTLSAFTRVSFEKDGEFVSYSSTSDSVDFTNTVKFRFVNGADTLIYDVIAN